MAWYEQDGTTQHTATYHSVGAWQRERDRAAQHGWSTRSTNPRPDARGRIVIHYTRTVTAEAAARVQHASVHLAGARSKQQQAKQSFADTHQQVLVRLDAARTDEQLDPVRLESRVLSTARQLRGRKRTASAARGALQAAISRAEGAYAHAASVRAHVGPAPDLASERARVLAAPEPQAPAQPPEEIERAVLEAQTAVVQAVKAWQHAVGARWETAHSLAATEARLGTLAKASRPPTGLYFLGSWRQYRRSQLEKKAARLRINLTVVHGAVPQAERTLVAALQRRDGAFARFSARGAAVG